MPAGQNPQLVALQAQQALQAQLQAQAAAQLALRQHNLRK